MKINQQHNPKRPNTWTTTKVTIATAKKQKNKNYLTNLLLLSCRSPVPNPLFPLSSSSCYNKATTTATATATAATTTTPITVKKLKKLPPNCSRPQRRAQNRAPLWTLLNYENWHFRGQEYDMCRMQTKNCSQIFSSWYMHRIEADEDPRKPIFYKRSTLSTWARARIATAQIRFWFANAQLLLHDVTNSYFLHSSERLKQVFGSLNFWNNFAWCCLKDKEHHLKRDTHTYTHTHTLKYPRSISFLPESLFSNRPKGKLCLRPWPYATLRHHILRQKSLQNFCGAAKSVWTFGRWVTVTFPIIRIFELLAVILGEQGKTDKWRKAKTNQEKQQRE